MKKKKKYEKPRIEFHDLQLKEEIANTCWGGHGNPKMTWYYDTKGIGYVSFQIGGGKCTLNLSNVKYYKDKDDPGTLISSGPQYNELYTALKNSGGESGNPFKGEDTGLFPNKPNEGWS